MPQPTVISTITKDKTAPENVAMLYMHCSIHRIKKKTCLCVPLFEETTRTTNVRTRGSEKYMDITVVKKMWENLKQHM
jgi:hypothetical protein